MPQETKSKGGDADSGERSSLQGLVATREDEAALLDALEQAFDYRGDVTLGLTDGSEVSGYIFDRRRGETLARSTLRLLPAKSEERVTVTFDRIDRVEFTGKDTAHGKSFERWIQQYIEKKRAGESASIESESLD